MKLKTLDYHLALTRSRYSVSPAQRGAFVIRCTRDRTLYYESTSASTLAKLRELQRAESRA